MTVPKGPIRVPVANYDGEIYMLEVDASGFLRVVTETTALPSDAATETSLALVRDRIGALTSPASGSVNKQLELIRGYLDNVETLLNGGLPAALDGTDLKVKEQSPITGFATDTEVQAVRDRLGALTSPASGSVNKQLELIRSYLDGVETLLNGGLPAALDGTDLKVKEQSPLTGYALATGQVSALSELQAKLETADLNITASKELVVLLTAFVGAVETSLVAFAGGILKTAFGHGDLTRAYAGGVLASGAGWTNLVNLSVPGLLTHLDFATNYNASDLHIAVDGDDLSLLERDGSGVRYILPIILNFAGGETTFFKEDLYDDGNSFFHFHLKVPIQYNASLLIEYRQASGVNKNIAVAAYYRGIG